MFIFTIGDIIGLSIWGLFISAICLVWGVGKVQKLVKGKRNDRT